MARNKALMATTPLGYMPMHLPEEAEEGDERTKAAIMRDKQQQEKEEKLQQQRQESLARFKKREWDHGRFHALQSMRLSREQLQVKVRGALDAYGVRSNAAELRSKVEVSLVMLQGASVSITCCACWPLAGQGAFILRSLMHWFFLAVSSSTRERYEASIWETDWSNRPAQLAVRVSAIKP